MASQEPERDRFANPTAIQEPDKELFATPSAAQEFHHSFATPKRKLSRKDVNRDWPIEPKSPPDTSPKQALRVELPNISPYSQSTESFLEMDSSMLRDDPPNSVVDETETFLWDSPLPSSSMIDEDDKGPQDQAQNHESHVVPSSVEDERSSSSALVDLIDLTEHDDINTDLLSHTNENSIYHTTSSDDECPAHMSEGYIEAGSPPSTPTLGSRILARSPSSRLETAFHLQIPSEEFLSPFDHAVKSDNSNTSLSSPAILAPTPASAHEQKHSPFPTQPHTASFDCETVRLGKFKNTSSSILTKDIVESEEHQLKRKISQVDKPIEHSPVKMLRKDSDMSELHLDIDLALSPPSRMSKIVKWLTKFIFTMTGTLLVSFSGWLIDQVRLSDNRPNVYGYVILSSIFFLGYKLILYGRPSDEVGAPTGGDTFEGLARQVDKELEDKLQDSAKTQMSNEYVKINAKEAQGRVGKQVVKSKEKHNGPKKPTASEPKRSTKGGLPKDSLDSGHKCSAALSDRGTRSKDQTCKSQPTGVKPAKKNVTRTIEDEEENLDDQLEWAYNMRKEKNALRARAAVKD
ncbi:hypothetical protein EJ05DRAFT_495729 [Pseudovirgaria hyperparasitica]|uniref:Uncharacterized protein n=1 Tax=Pseudovirgaria hyperparasitica TaxID=470096 RepID=A0A6A6WL16_9PEZI|nr:uncharacterized protein EJ05DRAFT_495729 [Pseudovirgaria hyperparasitica]KAF2762878.1 hypothetical protein EJ05DRAFT_495729 [Pseudovirgaria hyperparasitica]